jgi:hypothetical protein
MSRVAKAKLIRRAVTVGVAGMVSLFASFAAAAEEEHPRLPVPCAPVPLPPADPFGPGSLLLRFTAGPGYMWGSGDADTGLQSAAGGFGMTMGAFLVRGLALHGDFTWVNGFDPDFWVDGNVDHTTDLIFQTSTFHAGVSYYSAPMRVFASLGVGVGFAMMTSYYYSPDYSITASTAEYSNAGPAFQIQLGKEWPLGRFWGLGVVVDYQYLHVNVKEDDARIVIDDAQQLGLRFVATFAGLN